MIEYPTVHRDLVGTFSDGSLLTTGVDCQGAPERAVYRRYTPDGELIDTVGTSFSRDTYRVGRNTFPTPFGRRTWADVWPSGDGLVVGEGESYEIAVHTPEGSLSRLIRLERPDRPVTDEDLRRLGAIERASIEGIDPEWRRAIEEKWAAAPIPDRKPAHGRLLCDEDGNLWVADFVPRTDVEDRWIVFGSDGVQQGVFQAPPGFTLQRAGADRVFGVFIDSLDVQGSRVPDPEGRVRLTRPPPFLAPPTSPTHHSPQEGRVRCLRPLFSNG